LTRQSIAKISARKMNARVKPAHDDSEERQKPPRAFEETP